MSHRTQNCFARLKQQNKKAFIPFLTAGDPDLALFKDTLFQLPANGADIIEIGIPFSDPLADGPIIQASYHHSLKQGTHLDDIFTILTEFRTIDTTTPIILMTHMNPLIAYKIEAFAKSAHQAGIDGVLAVDLPIEEHHLLEQHLAPYAIDSIKLITPNTPSSRLNNIIKAGSGFLYYVSVIGVTGVKTPEYTHIADHVTQLQQLTDLPIVIGFGIKSVEQVKCLSEIADGIVVGSHLVNIWRNVPDYREAQQQILHIVKTFSYTLHQSC